MTGFFAPQRETVDNDDFRSSVGSDRLPEEILLPIIAGAYARGVADTLELLGIPALFFDGDGRVLHANSASNPFVDGPLRLRTHHLIARDAADNHALSELIAVALKPSSSLTPTLLPKAGLTIYALPLPDHLRTAGQMVRAILLISNADDSAVAMLARRMATFRI
ncbi:hypothetical protein [Lichenifustis flavocetrariae]|uniref:Uncharacterized protein n=1 Tax=Lichenifustis flavocetrariae TaxID=2949735 RepID=A0AA42CJE6_9HYPH|nr:hypothetical protein [Lichenifustis flavocetrariae]MCW6509498.1 hypothetical protein [Lichenifustis flavocetrariae]